jgi:hypothetical protein
MREESEEDRRSVVGEKKTAELSLAPRLSERE